MTPKSLYLHIPFCEKICAYCDFTKVYSCSFSHKEYLSVLFSEIEDLKIPFDSLNTIYIGGGTPSSLNEEELESLLSFLHARFPHLKEFTLEANPESLSLLKIKICQKNGVNRISLGVQSTNPSILKYLNRNHTNEELIECITHLRTCHFLNYNLDFIYGIPNQTKEDLIRDIEFCKEYASTHLSFYSLQIEEGTMLYNQKAKAVSDEVMRQEYDFILTQLESMGFHRYEVSNFAKKGYESRHNLTYWHDEQYYACGVSASGYVQNQRYTNTHSLTRYLKKDFNRSVENIDEKAEEFEFLMLNLRLWNGFPLEKFKQRFHKDFLIAYRKEIEEVKDYVNCSSNSFSIKEPYLFTMDSILLTLLKI